MLRDHIDLLKTAGRADAVARFERTIMTLERIGGRHELPGATHSGQAGG
jgi:hypothetical protein